MIYVFLANGFEEVEAICPVDIMRRANLSVTTVGIGGLQITGSHGITVTADIDEAKLDLNDTDMIFLPGGMPGTLNLAANDTVKKAIKYAVENDKYIAAICAAPSILGEMGLLQGKEAICYPGFEDKLHGATISKKRVVKDGKIITAAGMGVATDIGLCIVETLVDPKTANSLRAAVTYD